MQRTYELKDTLLRLFWLCGGITLLALGLIGKGPDGLQVSLWRRAAVIAGGLFFIYVSLLYYLPKYRKMRKELDKDLDEIERELNEIEREKSPPSNSKT